MIILKPNANQDPETSPEMIDILWTWTDREFQDRRSLWGMLHIDYFYEPQHPALFEIYEILNSGKEVAVDISVNEDWLQEQRELEA